MEFTGIIIALIYGLVCGFVSKSINNNRGRDGGFWWGFFLGVIGIIVVAVRPKDVIGQGQQDRSPAFLVNLCGCISLL